MVAMATPAMAVIALAVAVAIVALVVTILVPVAAGLVVLRRAMTFRLRRFLRLLGLPRLVRFPGLLRPPVPIGLPRLVLPLLVLRLLHRIGRGRRRASRERRHRLSDPSGRVLGGSPRQ